ncbi:N-acyl amino acid synthase FeeM domain-containing protein [Aquamicrobium zhengzhouense]|uniref:N-acyl amino acid synthase FeeM catalytic core domain-containing protein n=1 Tax=Aquamicrobium zhengzhouense TaxID=2781738 RepID=A0ABS0SGM9_9HYPH|nr:hypothetical protein [Aquamicrobium zhengzhouense]MBI1622462.1 hypothetical protein [Aquamicrobium zhengzhouense]
MSSNVTALRGAVASERPATAGRSAFVANIFSALERTEYRRCESGEDLEDIYRLRYKAYRRTEMVGDNQHSQIYDDLDDQQNCHRFGVYIDGVLVSTLRLHHVSAEAARSPSTIVYPDILMPRVDAGETFIDPSRFAADPDWTKAFPQIPYITLRLAGMACMHFATPYCLSTIRPDHGGFYRRIYHSEQIGALRDYPGLNYQVVLYQADVNAIRTRSFARFPFFRSTPMEQRLMFGETMPGEPRPLTILPTAQYAA